MSLSIRRWLVHYIESGTPVRGTQSLTARQILTLDQETTSARKTLLAFKSQETTSAQIAGIAFRIVQDMEVKSLTPLDVSTFAEVLELPLGVVWQEIELLSELTVELLRSLSEKKPLKRNEGTWLTFQIAYLRGLQQIVNQEFRLKKPWLNRAMVPAAGGANAALSDAQLQALLKTLRPARLSDTQAEQALSVVADSFLVQQMNNVCVAWLVANGALEAEAKLLTQRLVHSLGGHLLLVVADNAVPLAQLQKFVGLGSLGDRNAKATQAGSYLLSAETEVLASSDSINTVGADKLKLNLERYRASLMQALSEPLRSESFALKDLYVPLKGVPSAQTGNTKPAANPDKKSGENCRIDLRSWAQDQLADLETIALIEAPPGGGKTSFCQLWAAQVADELYPSWMPVLINLRNATLGKTLEQTLESAFEQGKFTSWDASWLNPVHPPCLLLLDGLDELPRSQGHNPQAAFVKQLLRFQAQTDAADSRYKIVVTSRVGEEDFFTSYSASKFRRITVQGLDHDEFKQWFKVWSKVQTKAIAQAYFAFLKQAGIFRGVKQVEQVANLIRQPLMIYLLGILHREGRLDDKILQMSSAEAKFEIYDRIEAWLSQSDRGDESRFAEAIPSITNLLQPQPEEKRSLLQLTALKILQSDLNAISPEETVANALPAFYFHSWATGTQFSHPTLGEYLCAEGIAAGIGAIANHVTDRYGVRSFAVDEQNVAQHIYNLLGYGILSPEIEELVLQRLRRSSTIGETFSFQVLFERLEFFYRAYCRGRWLDEGVTHTAWSYFHSIQNSLNVIQIEAVVGLNVFLLLCACHKEAKVAFFPCGKPGQDFNPDQLLALISSTAVLSPFVFAARSRNNLTALNLAGARLSQAMLAGINFWRTDLSAAELIGVNLQGANLTEVNLAGANLTGANLGGVNLSGTNLQGANLTRANLHGCNLTSANLTNACLFQAILDDTQKNTASLNGALFSLEQFEAFNRVMNSKSVSHTPSVQRPASFGGDEPESTVFLIESAEGELMLPDAEEYSAEQQTAFMAENSTGF